MSGGSSGEPPAMVKYGPPWPKTLGERLARYAWGSQDGAAASEQEEEEEWPPLQWHEDIVRPVPDTPDRVSPRVQREDPWIGGKTVCMELTGP